MCGSNRQRAILLASDQFSSTESTGHGRVKHNSTVWPRLSTPQEVGTDAPFTVLVYPLARSQPVNRNGVAFLR